MSLFFRKFWPTGNQNVSKAEVEESGPAGRPRRHRLRVVEDKLQPEDGLVENDVEKYGGPGADFIKLFAAAIYESS